MSFIKNADSGRLISAMKSVCEVNMHRFFSINYQVRSASEKALEMCKEQFEKIDYIVEFELLSNVWNSSPYYVNRSTNSTVIVYLDGTKEISKYNPFNVYFSTNYTSDFSDIIESVEDYHGEYDQILDLS